MEWHDCKTDPPKGNGYYILWYKDKTKKNGYDNNWNKSRYDIMDEEWSNGGFVYGNPIWGYSNLIPYKWAEVDLSGGE